MAEIKVYHGSTCEVQKPSLAYGRKDADFGVGFYVTSDKDMAEKWAARKRNSIVNVYSIDLDNLNGVEFELNKGWLDFIMQNRHGSGKLGYDLSGVDYIQGATADDRLFAVMEQYENNLLGADVAIKAINSMHIGVQIAIVFEVGISSLTFRYAYELSADKRVRLQKSLSILRADSNATVEQILKDLHSTEKQEQNSAPTFRYKSKRSDVF